MQPNRPKVTRQNQADLLVSTTYCDIYRHPHGDRNPRKLTEWLLSNAGISGTARRFVVAFAFSCQLLTGGLCGCFFCSVPLNEMREIYGESNVLEGQTGFGALAFAHLVGTYLRDQLGGIAMQMKNELLPVV